jgi:Ca-activated chloride channel family protein
MVRRRTHWLAAALVFFTLAGGTAARIAGRATPAPGAPAATPGSVLTAPSNGPVRFTGRLDKTAVLQGGDGLVRMGLVIRGEERPLTESARVPTDLVVVLDRSGSMSRDKIQHARSAAHTLIDSLTAEDRFAFVTYSSDSVIDIPLSPATHENRQVWRARVSEVGASGGTNMSSGLDLALAQVESHRQSGRMPRVILISDGLANQGDATREGLVRRASRAAVGEYVLTTVGVGADFDEGLMAALADAGTGNFHFLATGANLAEIFAKEFEATRTTVASGLAIEVKTGKGVHVVDAAGYPLHRSADGTVRIQPGALFAGQERNIWVTLRVPTHDTVEHSLGSFTLDYTVDGERHRLDLGEPQTIATVADEDSFFGRVDVEAWEQSVKKDEYNKLRRDVSKLVKEGKGDEALEQVRTYRGRQAYMNERLQSSVVSQNLTELDELEKKVEEHETGKRRLTPYDLKTLRALGYVR